MAGGPVVALTQPASGERDVVVTARHPLGRAPDREIVLHRDAGRGLYVADQPLPPGRWLVEIIGRRGAERLRFEDEVRA
ncbi:MAG: FixH family protein [Sphingomonas bacterium]